MEFLKVTHSKEDGKFYIAPMSAQNNGRYLVVEDTEARANQVKAEMANPEAPITPLTSPERFEQVSTAVSGTPVYRPLF